MNTLSISSLSWSPFTNLLRHKGCSHKQVIGELKNQLLGRYKKRKGCLIIDFLSIMVTFYYSLTNYTFFFIRTKFLRTSSRLDAQLSDIGNFFLRLNL